MAKFATSGARRRLVTIEHLAMSKGASGRPVETWTTLTKAWMERIDLGGEERFRADQLSAKYDTRWKMPYQVNMDPERVNVPKKRRLRYLERVYDIVTAMPIKLHTIELMTISRAAP